MNGSANTKCLICRSGKSKTVFSYIEPDRYELSVGVKKHKDYFRKWVRCVQCGFYYSVYSRAQDLISKIYASAYRSKDAAWRQDSPEERFRVITALPASESETKFRVAWIKNNVEDIWQNGLLKKGNYGFG